MQPAWCPDPQGLLRGSAWLAWVEWDHPNMPWDGTELWVAGIGEDGRLNNARQVAGGDSESICQPEWSPAGDLYFVSDRTGWSSEDEASVPSIETSSSGSTAARSGKSIAIPGK